MPQEKYPRQISPVQNQEAKKTPREEKSERCDGFGEEHSRPLRLLASHINSDPT
jgi:hypothetical protein